MTTPQELRELVKGLTFVTVTPFDEDGRLDLDAYRYNVRWMMEKTKGIECCITPCGSNGEFAHMNEDEHKAVLKACIEEVRGQHPVIAGAGAASTYHTIRMSQYAQEIGADGVQIILPYYFVPTEEGMLLHFKKLAEAIDIGIVVYNNPMFTSSWIKPQLMLKIIDACNGKISGVKENTPHLMLFDALCKALKPTGVGVVSGMGEKWYAYQFPYGAAGMLSPFGNFFPEYPIEMYKASKKNDFDKIRSLLEMMDPYYSFVGRCSKKYGDTSIQPKPGGAIYGEGNLRFGITKAAMNLVGLKGGHMRLPLTGISQEETEELKGILKNLGLIS